MRSRSLGRTCSCGTSITDENISGQCNRCRLRDPNVEAKRLAALKAKRETDPAYMNQLRNNMRRIGLAAGRDPAITAQRRERGKVLYATKLNTPETRAKVLATRPEVGRKVRATKLAWCPPEYWDEYLFLLKRKKLSREEARRIIFDTIKRKEEKLSPFERQERALRKGAQLVANDTQPSLANPADFGEKKWA